MAKIKWTVSLDTDIADYISKMMTSDNNKSMIINDLIRNQMNKKFGNLENKKSDKPQSETKRGMYI